MMTADNEEREKSAMEEWKGGEKNPRGKKQRLILETEFFEQFSVYWKEHVWLNRLQMIASPNSILKCTGHG